MCKLRTKRSMKQALYRNLRPSTAETPIKLNGRVSEGSELDTSERSLGHDSQCLAIIVCGG